MISSPQIWPVGAPLSLLLCLFYMTPLFSISILSDATWYFRLLLYQNHLFYKNHPCFQRSVAHPESSLEIKIWPLEHHCFLTLSVERIGIYLYMHIYKCIYFISIYTDNFEFTLRLPISSQHHRFILASSFPRFHHFPYREKPDSLYFTIPTFNLSVFPYLVPFSALPLP